MAIERLIRENLGLRARLFELPQADADILTASLRANPLFYADSQLVPYGSYSRERPGGPVQYDINITYPLDVTHKRKARTLVARRAKRVLEAQYQDAVRVQIDNLYMAYTDVLGVRETIRFAQAAPKVWPFFSIGQDGCMSVECGPSRMSVASKRSTKPPKSR